MAHSKDGSVQGDVADALSSAFSHLTDKEQAWKDLLDLAKDGDKSVQGGAATALFSAFPCLGDEEHATKDLLDLVKDGGINVQGIAANTLGSAFPHLTDKEQAWNDLLALVKDEDINVQMGAAKALGSAFPHLADKEQAWNDLLALVKDEDINIQKIAALSINSAFPHLADQEQAWNNLLALAKDGGKKVQVIVALSIDSAFPHLANKEQAWKDLLALSKDEDIEVRGIAILLLNSAFPLLADKEQAWKGLLVLAKDENINFRATAVIALNSAFPHLANKEQALKGLLDLAKDEDISVRMGAATALSSAARHYVNGKDFFKASQCFSEASSAFKYSIRRYIIVPKSEFYLYGGFGYYYQGRALVSELPENDPEAYVKNIKNAVEFFSMSISYINKSGLSELEDEAPFFPICLNIYSALYEYNLCYLNFDKKRFTKIKNYLDTASAECKIAGNQRGEDLVGILEKLTSSLKIRLEGIEQEKKKRKAAENGKGSGLDVKYEIHIDKLGKDFKDSLVEIDNALNELEAPMFKKIALVERESLERLQSREPKTRWQRLYDIINKYRKIFWAIIAAIALLLVTVAAIIMKGQFIVEFFSNLSK